MGVRIIALPSVVRRVPARAVAIARLSQEGLVVCATSVSVVNLVSVYRPVKRRYACMESYFTAKDKSMLN